MAVFQWIPGIGDKFRLVLMSLKGRMEVLL